MTKRMSGKVPTTLAGILLTLLASSGESLAAYRFAPAATEPSPEAGSTGSGPVLPLAALRLGSGKLGEPARKAVRQWPATQDADRDRESLTPGATFEKDIETQ